MALNHFNSCNPCAPNCFNVNVPIPVPVPVPQPVPVQVPVKVPVQVPGN